MSTARPASILTPMFALLPMVAAACGGGGGGGGDAKNIAGATLVTATFPTARCLTNERTMTVRGKATNPAQIAGINVAGIAATTTDGFATWEATVGLTDTTTQIGIFPFDRGGKVLAAFGVAAEFEQLPDSVHHLALDPNRRQLLAAEDFDAAGLVALDLASGRWIEVSGPGRGGGEEFTGFGGVTVDAAADVAFGFVRNPTRIVAIELVDGDRSVLSDETGGNLKIVSPAAIELDAAHDRLLVLDSAKKAIVAVKRSDGVRSVFSDATHGSGPAFASPQRAHLIESQGRLLVVDTSTRSLLSVDLANGNRTLIADNNRGSGGKFGSPRGVSFDPATGDALLADSSVNALYRVNLATGDRIVVSDAATGAGEPFRFVDGVAGLEDGSGRALVFDIGMGTALAVAVATGDREVLDRVRIGGASPLGRVASVEVDRTSGHVFAGRNFPESNLIEIDPLTGEHFLVASAERGSGPMPGLMFSTALSPERGVMLALDADLVFSIDLLTGDRTIIASDSVGSGEPIHNAAAIAVDEPRGVAYVADAFASTHPLLRLDLDTGVRIVVSSPTRGEGPLFDCPRDLVISADGTEAFILDECDLALFRIDLISGDREIVTGAGLGPGPEFEQLLNGLELDPDRRHAYVNDDVLGVVQVDVVTGAREVISGPTRGHGPVGGLSIRLAADGEHLLAMPANGVGLLEIDLATGDRAIVSY